MYNGFISECSLEALRLMIDAWGYSSCIVISLWQLIVFRFLVLCWSTKASVTISNLGQICK